MKTSHTLILAGVLVTGIVVVVIIKQKKANTPTGYAAAYVPASKGPAYQTRSGVGAF